MPLWGLQLSSLVVGNQGEAQTTQDVLGYGIGPKAQQYSPMNTLDAGIVALNKVTGHADRNGYFYVVDRANGDFKKAFPFVDNITWATSIGDDGYLKAFNSETGKVLWQCQTGSGVISSPVTWEMDGEHLQHQQENFAKGRH